MVYYDRWFPHDANASRDPKIRALIAEFGWEAYGWFWDILEQLHNTPTHSIAWDQKYVKISMASEFRTTVERLSTVVERMLNDLQLLYLENGSLRSKGMDRHIENASNKKAQASAAGKASAEKRAESKKEANDRSTTVERPMSDRSTPVQRKSSEKEEKEEKERKRGGRARTVSSIPPAIEDIQKYAEGLRDGVYPIESQYRANAVSQVSKFFDNYTANGWKVNKNPMKDWQATYRNWLRREKDFGQNKLETPKTASVPTYQPQPRRQQRQPEAVPMF